MEVYSRWQSNGVVEECSCRRRRLFEEGRQLQESIEVLSQKVCLESQNGGKRELFLYGRQAGSMMKQSVHCLGMSHAMPC